VVSIGDAPRPIRLRRTRRGEISDSDIPPADGFVWILDVKSNTTGKLGLPMPPMVEMASFRFHAKWPRHTNGFVSPPAAENS